MACLVFIYEKGYSLEFGTLAVEGFGQGGLSETDENLVVLIHGWNPSGDSNKYTTPEWLLLYSEIAARLKGRGWKISKYHWEEDAATGLISGEGHAFFSNASRAAENAEENGIYLAGLILDGAPNIRKVHLIAHSAGSWAAYQAALKLLQESPFVQLQVTLLDPYIPGVWEDDQSGNDSLKMGVLDDFSRGRIYRLENYYSVDFKTDILGSTSRTFPWSSFSGNIQANIDGPYAEPEHSLPIFFYAETAKASVNSSGNRGWFRSMANEEHLFPKIVNQPSGDQVPLGSSHLLEVTLSNDSDKEYQWFRNGEEIPGAISRSLSVSPRLPMGVKLISITRLN